MKFLVTGAAGFIGFHVSKRLLNDGHQVVGIDNINDYYDVKLKESRVEQLESPSFTFYKLDLADRDGMAKLFETEQFERVIHLAAQAGVRYSLENPYAYADSNLTGYLNILEGCRHNKVQHLLYASSSSVYGLNRKMPFSTDDSVDHPVSLYAATFLPDEFNQRQVHETSLYRTPGPWTGASDEAEWTNDKKEKLINNNSIDATEGTMVLYRWKSWFSGIHEAAVFTENVDQAPLTVTERNQWKAEARALRAIYYFYLVRTYGPVPLLEKDFPMDTPSDELQLSRNTVDECFDFIVSELKGAQNDGLLDDASTDKVSGYGRIDKAIAQAFIIEALTYRASWLFNGECTYYSGLANTDGTKLFPNKPDEATKRANWQKVIDECNTFFSNYGSRYHLMYTNKDGVAVSGPDSEGFSPTESYRRAVRTLFSEMGNNKEMIFYRLDNAAGTMQYDRMPNRSGNTTNYRGGSLLGATQEMVDAYFMSNGESPISGYSADGVTPIINEKSDYVEEGAQSGGETDTGDGDETVNRKN